MIMAIRTVGFVRFTFVCNRAACLGRSGTVFYLAVSVILVQYCTILCNPNSCLGFWSVLVILMPCSATRTVCLVQYCTILVRIGGT